MQSLHVGGQRRCKLHASLKLASTCICIWPELKNVLAEFNELAISLQDLPKAFSLKIKCLSNLQCGDWSSALGCQGTGIIIDFLCKQLIFLDMIKEYFKHDHSWTDSRSLSLLGFCSDFLASSTVRLFCSITKQQERQSLGIIQSIIHEPLTMKTHNRFNLDVR